MSYDLHAWPVDRAMSDEEAIADIEARMNAWKLGLRRDKRIAAFAQAMKRQFPGLGTGQSVVPMEFDVHPDRVFMALPWSMVAELIETIAPMAFDEGLALFDPQRMHVALPAPYGPSPMGTSGTAEHERLAARALDAITRGAAETDDPFGGINEIARGAGFTVMSPLGFEITPDVEADVMADPLRVPPALQTGERKAQLIRDLSAARANVRHEALMMLSGWDPDEEVRAAILPLLDSDDVFAAGRAAQIVARQGRSEDLPAVLETVHRMSPADGGTLESMMGPLSAAFALARMGGGEWVADVRAKALAWREPPAGIRTRGHRMSDDEFVQMLDAFAAGPEEHRRLN